MGGEDAYKRIDISLELIDKGWDITILGTKDYSYPSAIRFVKYNLNRGLNPFADFKTLLF